MKTYAELSEGLSLFKKKPQKHVSTEHGTVNGKEYKYSQGSKTAFNNQEIPKEVHKQNPHLSKGEASAVYWHHHELMRQGREGGPGHQGYNGIGKTEQRLHTDGKTDTHHVVTHKMEFHK